MNLVNHLWANKNWKSGFVRIRGLFRWLDRSGKWCLDVRVDKRRVM